MEDGSDIERILTSTPKDHSTPAMTLNRQNRKTLQTIQPLATGSKLNGGNDGSKQHKDNSLKIYEDSSLSENSTIARCSRPTQTDDSLLEDLLQNRLQHLTDVDDSGRVSGYIDQEAYDLMVREEVSETYWRELAEERRRALKETLAENEKLCIKIERLTEENRQLTEKNSNLTDVAAKAESLEKLLESILSDDESSRDIEEGSTEDADVGEEHSTTSNSEMVVPEIDNACSHKDDDNVKADSSKEV